MERQPESGAGIEAMPRVVPTLGEELAGVEQQIGDASAQQSPHGAHSRYTIDDLPDNPFDPNKWLKPLPPQPLIAALWEKKQAKRSSFSER